MAEEYIEGSAFDETHVSYLSLRSTGLLRIGNPKPITFPVLDHLIGIDLARMLVSHGEYTGTCLVVLSWAVWMAVDDKGAASATNT